MNTQKLSRIEQLHKETGKFIGAKVNGRYELYDLNDIKVKKDSTVPLAHFTKEMFEDKIKTAFEGSVSSIRMLILKLIQASDTEKDLYLSIMAQYRGLNKEDERFKMLSFISIESGLSEYKANKKSNS